MENGEKPQKKEQKLTWHVKITFNFLPLSLSIPALAVLCYSPEFIVFCLSWDKFYLVERVLMINS